MCCLQIPFQRQDCIIHVPLRNTLQRPYLYVCEGSTGAQDRLHCPRHLTATYIKFYLLHYPLLALFPLISFFLLYSKKVLQRFRNQNLVTHCHRGRQRCCLPLCAVIIRSLAGRQAVQLLLSSCQTLPLLGDRILHLSLNAHPSSVSKLCSCMTLWVATRRRAPLASKDTDNMGMHHLLTKGPSTCRFTSLTCTRLRFGQHFANLIEDTQEKLCLH